MIAVVLLGVRLQFTLLSIKEQEIMCVKDDGEHNGNGFNVYIFVFEFSESCVCRVIRPIRVD